ncbi:hypothetical protein F511_29928 [Dorcoceras hygrometricum]|uniref:Uncharacterized protein n=1 Tax=Dorcoceras hygrometricum TaxID=472368 RepID=A0A2Z7AFD4_9LAMI|nr:hypothetical protein F511_29928 [Dorcoceras hygrometricum]
MADDRLPHLCAYKYQRTTTEFLTPFRNSQSEKKHFFATKCCGNSSRFLAKVLRKLRRSPGILLPDFSPCTVTIQHVRELERIRAIDLLPDFVQRAGFMLPDFTPDSYTRFYQISDFSRRQIAVVSINPNDIGLLSLTSSINCWLHCSSLLIADVTADFIITDRALALLFTTADCDDITADVVIAAHSFLQ